MKIKLLLLLLVITFQSYSQVSVGPKHSGKSDKFKKGVLDKFKNTQTIFVLSNVYDKGIYEQILKDSWNVTPYIIVDFENFKLDDYLSDKYSIAKISGLIKIKELKYGGTASSLFTFIDINMYDSESVLEKKNKLSPRKWTNKREEILTKYCSKIALFYLYQKDDFIETAAPSSNRTKTFHEYNQIINSPEYMDSVIDAMFSENIFYNYNPGLLKNYFQKINNLIKNEEIYWMYEDDYLPELKELTQNKLYIPSYMTIEYSGWTRKDSEKTEKNILEVFEKYEYQYEIISDEDLSNKIMNNEELYYLRYVRMNSLRYLQIVNSKTGEIIYRNFIKGLSYKIKSKHIEELNSKIKKVVKKYNKL